jgi:hypothetical protein
MVLKIIPLTELESTKFNNVASKLAGEVLALKNNPNTPYQELLGVFRIWK